MRGGVLRPMLRIIFPDPVRVSDSITTASKAPASPETEGVMAGGR